MLLSVDNLFMEMQISLSSMTSKQPWLLGFGHPAAHSWTSLRISFWSKRATAEQTMQITWKYKSILDFQKTLAEQQIDFFHATLQWCCNFYFARGTFLCNFALLMIQSNIIEHRILLNKKENKGLYYFFFVQKVHIKSVFFIWLTNNFRHVSIFWLLLVP